jgi:hypothetical protein
MPEQRTYKGSCHCGAVAYEATTDLAQVISCNCSRCRRLGSLLTFVGKDQFNLLSGESALADYRFNTKQIAHLFCKTCGIEPFARGKKPDGSEMVAVNVRCLDGVEPDQLTPTKFDGRSR